VIYDDDFEKNIISIEIMPNGRLKCSIELYYQIDFGNITDMEQKFKDYKAFSKAVLDSSLYKYKNRPQIYKTSSLH
jgi:cell division protein FtsQ